MNIAYFVKHSRTVENLKKQHTVNAERPYEVVCRVTLSAIEYENFITDMLADRQFIGDAATLCASGEVMKCLLVRQRGRTDGVLVVPEDESFVKWVAYVPDASEG